MTRSLLYIAGPYSSDPVLATRAVILTATEVYRHTEWVPVIPHLSHFWHHITPMPYEDWLTIDFAILARCHAIMRLPGDSSGADRELAFAARNEIPLVEFALMPQVVTRAYEMAVGALA